MTVDIESKLGYRVGVTAVPKHRIATCSARSHLRGDTRDRAGREACEVRGMSKIEELKRLVDELLTQDNLATANPLYCVQQKRRIEGIDSDYDPEFAWWTEDFDGGPYSDGDVRAEILEEKPDDTSFWEFVCAHLTMKAAEKYIELNQHNLHESRVYVTSQYRCHEFNDFIASAPALIEAMEFVAEIADRHAAHDVFLTSDEGRARAIVAKFNGE